MAPITFATEALADGPIGYWRLGEAPGSASAADASGNANNGTYSGGITLGQPGFHGGDTAALFDGKTGRVVVPDSNVLNPPNITMEAKVRWDGPNDLQQRILEKSSFAELAQYGLSILPDGHVQWRFIAPAQPPPNVNSHQYRRGGAGRGDPHRRHLRWRVHPHLSQRRSGPQRNRCSRQHLPQTSRPRQPWA